nr:pseudouridine synthase [Thauera sp.]
MAPDADEQAPEPAARPAAKAGQKPAGKPAARPARPAQPADAGRPARPASGARPKPSAPALPSAGRAPRTETQRPARKPTPAPAAARRPAQDTPARSAADSVAPAPEGVRLSKVMAERGICSRREADEFIERGWVFVDGKRVSELGIRIDPEARINLAPEATRTQRQRVTILLHKPVGYVSGQPEPGYAPAVSLIGAGNQFDRDTAQRFHPSQLKNLAPAGRLDIDSTGLLVLTQDGRIARQLIGDDSKVDKEYLVRVEGRLQPEGLALLNHGLELDGVKLRPAKVEWINDDQLRFELREGRKRQIRRMCELVGLKVVGLKRVRIGKVKLGDLPLGEWRYLREDESF